MAAVSFEGKPVESSADKAERLLQKALSCKAIRELYEQAVATPVYKHGDALHGDVFLGSPEYGQKVTIDFVAKTESGSDGEYIPGTHSIYLLSNLSDERAISAFVFQLKDISNSPKIVELCNKAKEHRIECEDFVSEIKRIHFEEGALVHHRVMQAAAKEMGWSQKFDYSERFNADEYRKFWLIFSSRDSNVDRAERLLQKALSSKAIRELYEQAVASPVYKDGDISSASPPEYGQKVNVHFVAMTNGGFPAQTVGGTHIIRLLSNLSDEKALSYFVFELTNIIHSSRFNELVKAAKESRIDCEAFVKEFERIEFDGSLIHQRVMKAAIKEMGWRQKIYAPGYVKCLGFESNWLFLKFFTSHADAYRKMWQKLSGQRSSIFINQKINYYALNIVICLLSYYLTNIIVGKVSNF